MRLRDLIDELIFLFKQNENIFEIFSGAPF